MHTVPDIQCCVQAQRLTVDEIMAGIHVCRVRDHTEQVPPVP